MYEKTWHTGWSYGWAFFLPQGKDEMMGGVGKYFLLSSIKPLATTPNTLLIVGLLRVVFM